MKREGKMVRIASILMASAFILSVPTAGNAEETGWLSGYNALSKGRDLVRKGLFPVKMACRDSNKRQLDVGETEYNVTFAKNTNDTAFLWAVGSEYGPYKRKAAKEGYRQVSYKSYVRKKSGLTVHCAIWHK
jgi:hypothetical protein